jgi:hypothetical protein
MYNECYRKVKRLRHLLQIVLRNYFAIGPGPNSLGSLLTP